MDQLRDGTLRQHVTECRYHRRHRSHLLKWAIFLVGLIALLIYISVFECFLRPAEDEMDTDHGTTHDICCFEEDKKNANDPQHCIEYVDEIFSHLLSTERKHLPSPDYMDTIQNDINQNMRGILVDWLVEVAEEYKLSSENLYLSTNYVDRFLSVMPVLRGKLQLVGVSCMLIASKYEEIFAPQVEDFVYITDNTYTAEEVAQLKFDLFHLELLNDKFSGASNGVYCFECAQIQFDSSNAKLLCSSTH